MPSKLTNYKFTHNKETGYTLSYSYYLQTGNHRSKTFHKTYNFEFLTTFKMMLNNDSLLCNYEKEFFKKLEQIKKTIK